MTIRKQLMSALKNSNNRKLESLWRQQMEKQKNKGQK